jgi:hypothetical protein
MLRAKIDKKDLQNILSAVAHNLRAVVDRRQPGPGRDGLDDGLPLTRAHQLGR